MRYVWTEEELESAESEMGGKVELQRYKGLGEMMAEQLWETTMNPETRTLIQVSIDDEALSLKRVTTLMGDNVELRRKWIESNVSFTLEDQNSILENEEIDHMDEGGDDID